MALWVSGGFYERLLSDAADSPVVKDAGNPNQFMGWRRFPLQLVDQTFLPRRKPG